MRKKALHFDIAQFESDLHAAREDVGDRVTVHFDKEGTWNNQISPAGHPRRHFAIREDQVGFLWENGTFERLSGKHTVPVKIYGLSQSQKETVDIPENGVAFRGYLRGQSDGEGVSFILQATDYVDIHTEALANLIAPFMRRGFPAVTTQLDYMISRVTAHRDEAPANSTAEDYRYKVVLTCINGATFALTTTAAELSQRLDAIFSGERARGSAQPLSYRVLALRAQHEIYVKQREIEHLEKERNRFLACAHEEGITKYRLAYDLGASEPSIDRWITKDTQSS